LNDRRIVGVSKIGIISEIVGAGRRPGAASAAAPQRIGRTIVSAATIF
jgi:hypothetical protein